MAIVTRRMGAKDNLLKNVLIFSIGNLGSRFLVFFLVPLFSYYLSTSEMGFYDLVVITIGLVVPMATIQLSESIYRWLLDTQDGRYHKTISSSFLTLSGIVLVVLFVFYVFTHFVPIKYKWLIGGYFLISCLHPFFLAVARGMRLNKLYAISGVVNSAVLVAINWLLLAKFSMGIKALFISHIVASSVATIMLFYGTKLYKYVSFKSFSKEAISGFVLYSLPLIPNAISWWFINSANRYIILYFLGEESNGVYALSSRVAMALYALNSIFNLAWQESAITEFGREHRDKFYSDVFNKYFILEMSVVILLMPTSKLFVMFFVSEEFLDSWQYMPMLLVGVAFATFSAFFGTGYLSAKKTVGAFSTTVYGALVNIILSLFLVPKIGLHGATLGIVAGFITTWLLRVHQTKKYFNIIFKKAEMILMMCLVAISLVVNFYIDNVYGLVTFALVAACAFVLLNSALLKKLIRKITQRKAIS